MDKAKAITFTIILLALLAVSLITMFIFRLVPSSPLGKTIEVTFVYPDGTPIGAGLDVTLYDGNNGITPITDTTDVNGQVTFAGLPDETYTWEWSWQGMDDFGQYKITCEKIVWEFTETVDYWTIQKTFTYPDGTQIEGLTVLLGQEQQMPMSPVVFSNLKAGTHVLEWFWQGKAKTEQFVIDFQTPSPVEKTNVLPYWTVEKTFVYEGLDIPVVGLSVTFDGKTATTDATGLVSFADVKAGDYSLMWVWGEVSKSEEVNIGFQTPTPVVLTNPLTPKSGGGISYAWLNL